jgi:hypothetical protein
MRYTIFALSFALLNTSLAGEASAACDVANAVIVDRSDFHDTAVRIQQRLKEQGVDATKMLYPEARDVEAFAKLVAAKQPRLVIAHLSTFRTAGAKDDRLNVFDRLVSHLVTQSPGKTDIIIYSTSNRRETPITPRAVKSELADPKKSILTYPLHVELRTRFLAGSEEALDLSSVVRTLIDRGICRD